MPDIIDSEEQQAIAKWLATNRPTQCKAGQYTESKPSGEITLKRGIRYGKGRIGNVQRQKREA